MIRRLFVRGLAAAALAVTILAVPIASVSACSCVGLSLAESVDVADIAFIGTVVDRAPGGQDALMGVPLVRYAFELERASEAAGPIVEVAAHDDGGGASCGFTFGDGERWFVAAAGEDGVLRTTLCSGNRLAGDLGADEMAALVQLLPVEPAPADEPRGDAGLSIPAPLLVALAGAGIVAAAAVWAFRRDRSS